MEVQIEKVRGICRILQGGGVI